MLGVIVGLIAACIFGCGQAKGRSGNVINPQHGQGMYLIAENVHTFLGAARLRDVLKTLLTLNQGKVRIWSDHAHTFLGAARPRDALETL